MHEFTIEEANLLDAAERLLKAKRDKLIKSKAAAMNPEVGRFCVGMLATAQSIRMTIDYAIEITTAQTADSGPTAA